ncbi:sensor histidine kinase [Rhodocytophaga rosea]|uniref:histidine kinase n=1 Tax=Rhodocytophaga rosea TaxID=2704465 RepID=A0A6C0GEV2_9BACT|nr:ATP-binding protein [Rhodocytophaga rosea]QHT66272.1 sensor histidine kinase [Rhodocytophaga rosea]
MQAIASEIQFVIAITLLLLLISSFVIAFMFLYQRQYHNYVREKEEMKNTYEQELLKAQLEIKEQTLQNISQEIHDNIGQILSLVKLSLTTLVIEDKGTSEKVSVAKDLVGKVIQDLRNLSRSLNTGHIHELKLSEALQFELDLIEKTGLYKTQLTVSGQEVMIDEQKRLIVFRIAQEVLQNIIKHAQASQICVSLEFTPAMLLLSVQDNGKGFDPVVTQAVPASDKGTGITNMHHRAKLIGAQFNIGSEPHKGSKANLSLPLSVNN